MVPTRVAPVNVFALFCHKLKLVISPATHRFPLFFKLTFGCSQNRCLKLVGIQLVSRDLVINSALCDISGGRMHLQYVNSRPVNCFHRANGGQGRSRLYHGFATGTGKLKLAKSCGSNIYSIQISAGKRHICRNEQVLR